jgi:iron complex transport system ATP-binding protein
MLLRLEAVTRTIGGRDLFRGATLGVKRNDRVGLVGPNGAGKTTLLRLLSGELQPTSGSIAMANTPITDLDATELALQQAVLAGNSAVRLPFAVREIVLMGRYPHRADPGNSRDIDRDIAIESMQLTDTAHLALRFYPTLSSGEQARVSVARVLAQRAPLMLLDEPTASLDISHREQAMRLLSGLAGAGSTVVAVLHDLNVAAGYADRLVLINEGRIVASGTPAEVLDPDLLEEVYGQAMAVVPHPLGKGLLVLPVDEA